MALNGQGVGTSALEDYQRHLRSLLNTAVHAEAEAVLEQIEGLADAVEEVSGDFTNAEGSALYKWHSKINHSWYVAELAREKHCRAFLMRG